jgi:hypothetical protein
MYALAGVSQGFRVNRSTDKGVTWNPVGDPISVLNTSGIRGMAVTPRGTIVIAWDSKLLTNDSTFVTTGVQAHEEVPLSIRIYQNYPNPFNPNTIIRFTLPKRIYTTLAIFNSLGQKIATLLDHEVDAGMHEITFDGSHLATGVYFYRLQSGNAMQTKRLLILR